MTFGSFIKKQFIDVIDWTEPEDGILAYRYPMQDREIQNGGKLTVRDSQMAVFVNEGKVADSFGPGLYTLNTNTLPILTYLKNWDKLFQSPFKSDVYFFSTRQQVNQHWGTPNPITIRDKDFGMIRMRGFGIYSYHITDPKTFYQKISGTRDQYTAAELEGQLRNTIIGLLTDTFASSQVPFLDLAANQDELAKTISEKVAPTFTGYGLTLDTFVVENVSLPDELQKVLDQRIEMNMVGNMQQYTQFQAAQSIPIAAGNEGGGAGIGAGLGAGIAMGQAIAGAVQGGLQGGQQPPTPTPTGGAPAAGGAGAATAAGATKFCMQCGNRIPRTAGFCPECGTRQS